MTMLKQTPSQTVGPYFAYSLMPRQYGYDFPSLFSPEIAASHSAGEHIVLTGKVFDGNGAAIADAMIEVLQPDAEGRYVETPAQARERGFCGFGRVGIGADPECRYVIETIKPGATLAGEAPHLDVIVMMRGLMSHVFTRIYFEDEAANETDPALQAVPAGRRSTLLAARETLEGHIVYRFDIWMQGERETVFFDV